MSNSILLVRVPTQEAVNGRKLRDYILESLAQGVLVLTEDASCEVMELPPLGGLMVTLTEQVMPAVERPELAAETGQPIMEADPEQKLVGLIGPRAGEKRVIMERLQAYRKKYGLDCWPAVVKASGGKLSDDQLRDMCAGTAVLPISEWHLADKALDKLYEKEAENG